MSSSGNTPKVLAGTLLTTDVPTKELILYLDRENNHSIVIEDLDDTHVFVNSQYVEYVKENVAALLESNMFERRDLEGR
jgi:TFIIH basal transcription factor complex TTD-A subunit